MLTESVSERGSVSEFKLNLTVPDTNLLVLNTGLMQNKTPEIPSESAFLPVSIFNNEWLSPFETISKYLKEELSFRYCEIALMTGRDDRTVWGAYNSASGKMPERLDVRDDDIFVPISILKDRNFSILESISIYLKENYGMKYSQIGAVMNRNERTIWTVCSRAFKKKRAINHEHF